MHATKERMGTYGGRSFREHVVWAIAIGVHVLLIVLFLRGSQHIRSEDPASDIRSVLYLLDLPPPVEEAPVEDEVPRRVVSLDVSEPSVPGTAITEPSEQPALRPPVDWYSEAEEVARASVDRGAQPGPRRFGEQPVSPYQKCKRPRQPEWEPEPERAGFAGGLPFVRLGERCIVGLGFFGCAVGKLPEANGRLLEDMKNPDRPTSSVPDIEDCVP